MDPEINSPLVGSIWFVAAGSFVWWYNRRLRDWKELKKSSQERPELIDQAEQLKRRVTLEGFAGMAMLILSLYVLAWLF